MCVPAVPFFVEDRESTRLTIMGSEHGEAGM
jgi:hypothetical protein